MQGFNTTSGFAADFNTERLLPNMIVGPSIATPIERRNKRNAIVSSTAFLNAVSSAPYTEVSAVPCLPNFQCTGVEFMKWMVPPEDLL